MAEMGWEKHSELLDRTCEALVLAYQPNQVLARDYDRKFYIPSHASIEEAFGYSLRSVFGTKEGGSHWADGVRWNTIDNLDDLEERIKTGSMNVLGGHPDEQTRFESYLSGYSPYFEHEWIYLKGDFYRFRQGKRKEALQNFSEYWSEEEGKRWKQLHKFMREYTQKEFEKKD